MANKATTTDEATELAQLRAENERLRELTKPKPLSYRVSAKGAVSVYGGSGFRVEVAS